MRCTCVLCAGTDPAVLFMNSVDFARHSRNAAPVLVERARNDDDDDEVFDNNATSVCSVCCSSFKFVPYKRELKFSSILRGFRCFSISLISYVFFTTIVFDVLRCSARS